MNYYTQILIGAVVLLTLSALAIYLVGRGRSDSRQGGVLIDARKREGYAYTDPQRTAARALSFNDPEGAYYTWDRTSRRRPFLGE